MMDFCIPYVRLDCNLTQPPATCGQQVAFLVSGLFLSTNRAGKDGRQRRFGGVAGA